MFPNESATREIKQHVIEGNVASCPDAYTKACEEENEMGNIYHCKKRGCKEYPRNKKAGGKTRSASLIRSDTFLAQVTQKRTA